jgi:hypothetical protein
MPGVSNGPTGPKVSFDGPTLIPLACTVDEAAHILGYSRGWLAKARMTGGGPKFIKRPRKVLYELAELHRWLSSQTKYSSTAEYARSRTSTPEAAA